MFVWHMFDLATASLNAYPGGVSSISTCPPSMEIEHEIISTIILLLLLIQAGLLAITYKSRRMRYCFVKLAQKKVWCIHMTIAVNWVIILQTNLLFDV